MAAVLIRTNVESFVVDLCTIECPLTCSHFIDLCGSQYYDQRKLFSIEKDIISTTNNYPIGDNPIELCSDIDHSSAGILGMLGETDFYITLADNLNSHDGEHTAFGMVAPEEGQDLFRRLNEAVERDGHIYITGTTVLKEDYWHEPIAKVEKEIEIEELRTTVLKEIDHYSEPVSRYSEPIAKVEKEIEELAKRIKVLTEEDTGLAPSSQWDRASDKKMMLEEPLRVATCTRIINPNTEDAKYVINVKDVEHTVKSYMVGLGDKVSSTDIDRGMRVGVDRKTYQIQIPLPPKIDPCVTMMTVEEKPDVTYDDVGGCKEQIEKIREKFVKLGIDPPKGVLCYGPPGTGKTLVARAVANRTDACFIRVAGSALVHKYVGEGARMVRELFQMARSKKACILFFDEIDSWGGARFDDGAGGDKEVQRTMLEILNQLDGFDARGNIKVLMATNRPDTLDPALLRPGRLDRKVEFCLPHLLGRTQIFKIHSRTMNCERDIHFELLARLCPNSTGADIRSVCTEAGMYAIRARRKTVTEKDFLEAVNRVIKSYRKFSATPKYMHYI